MTVAPAIFPTHSGDRDATNPTIVRPTEAQLRYAQFHHKRRAQAVKHRIDRLHRTPLQVTVVLAQELEEDNDNYSSRSDFSGTDTSDVDLRAVRLLRPKITSGRRALLKKSKRKYRRRKRDIAKHGYRGCFLDDNEDDQLERGEASEGDEFIDKDWNDIDKEENDAMQEIFMTRPKHQRRRARRHRTPSGGNAQSYKRFQAACHAMMRNIQTSQTKAALPAIEVPSKRWTRSEEHVAAAAAQTTDFYRYRTGLNARRIKSGRSAALLLNYAYYQQNQKDHDMDRGATWLTHLPAKQSKRGSSSYYFHNLDGLPPLISSANDEGEDEQYYDGDGNESSITLSMRQPGPAKFHRLMAYVQQRLIEKEKKEKEHDENNHQQKILMFEGIQNKSSSPEKSRTREIIESLEPKSENTNRSTRIRQMAESIEGKSSRGTPTITLRSGTPFSGFSSQGSQRNRRGKSRYVPRVRLRDFVVEGTDEDDNGEKPTPLPPRKLSERFQQEDDDGSSDKNELFSPPKIRLRDSFIGNEEKDTETNNRTREIALAFEADQDNGVGGSKVNQLRESLEPKTTPKIKLKKDFFGNDTDEKKITEREPSHISRSNVDRLSRQFQGQQERLEGLDSPSTEVLNEFSSHIDPRIFEQFQDEGSSKRQSAETNVTEFFARLRGEQQQQQQQQQQQREQRAVDLPMESVTQPASPDRDFDEISEISRASNLSGLWSRGRNSLNTITSNLNTIAENQTNKGKALLSPELIGRATHVSGKVSGLLNKFRGVPEDSEDVDEIDEQHEHFNVSQDSIQLQKQNIDLSTPLKLVHSPSADSHEALRAYRMNRASMSPEETDKMSDASSFHALPDQIRMVVQNSGEKPPKKSLRTSTTAPTTSQTQPLHNDQYESPIRSTITQSTLSQSELSNEQYKRAHGRFINNSALLGGEFQHETIIDTDGTQSDASGTADVNPQTLASLMMSPDMLQKRLKQAIASVEKRKWDQVLFLINANPWLAEMKELTTNQFLLHKLAFFGKGTPSAPMSLSEQLVEKFPAAVYKFDQDGNVPLHLAAAAGNVQMIQMLGEKFESGASIRNEDGMLPLHYAIASFAEFDSEQVDGVHSQPLSVLKTLLKLFPKAVAIADNDGNLPLHVASECLEGGIGVDVIFLLMDEAERQLQDPYGARFRNKVKIEDLMDDDMSARTMSTARDTDVSAMDSEMPCTVVLNNFNETPLLVAIRSHKGWEMIEALVSGPGGRKAALCQDTDKNNALHLLVGEFQDATAAMSILKVVPESALQRNAAGILPIEIACMQLMPEEVVLAIALVDLPVNIDDRDGLKVIKDRGESWIFLTCDSDDHMVNVVEEIVSICSFQQLQELCFMTEQGSENAIIDRATPKCREALNRALRFLGRFEFVGDGPLFSDMQTGFKAFDALDFGDSEAGKRVLLECYKNEFDFENRCYTMFEVELESNFVEEVNVYVEHLDDDSASKTTSEEIQQQRCVAIERPRLTLDKVVEGISKNGAYENNKHLRLKYSAKLCSVLRLIGKALRHLHSAGVVHGNVSLETCGKFDDSMWKLSERLDVQAIGKPFDPTRFRKSFPPESLESLPINDGEQRDGMVFDSDGPTVTFVTDMLADPSIDIWAFGKICYECLVGKPLIEFDASNSDSPSDDVIALLQTSEWNESNMETVFDDLVESGIGESGADMVTSCLFPQPEQRPADMDEILDNPFWQEIRRHRSPRKGRGGRKEGSIESTVSLFTDVEKYEV
ncbi:unnamed protein product [Pseudo-nitzschia multistriata]|uniref:Protein kinase domain-containing protein n=1 Tax=Pseudo-nitzschia multistriata TaxID=183589 RepID=A0A448Z1X9_9STRA|nr:unnamed protein product [Pseudo-nitzschia multistriata]